MHPQASGLQPNDCHAHGGVHRKKVQGLGLLEHPHRVADDLRNGRPRGSTLNRQPAPSQNNTSLKSPSDCFSRWWVVLDVCPIKVTQLDTHGKDHSSTELGALRNSWGCVRDAPSGNVQCGRARVCEAGAQCRACPFPSNSAVELPGDNGSPLGRSAARHRPD